MNALSGGALPFVAAELLRIDTNRLLRESNMNLESCLPPELRGSATTITRIAAGLSGAGVYRVDAAGGSFVLKVAADNESADDWHRTLQIQRLAAAAGLAPRMVHVSESMRAVLTAFVVDRSFIAFYRDPRTHHAALTQLGRTVRRIHALPLPADARMRDPRELLAQVWGGFLANFPLPEFVSEVVTPLLAAEPPASEQALVLGHNDLNPSNLVYDGEAILMLDWATAGPMDPLFDLAVLSVFLRMNQDTSLGLLSAYEGTQCAELSARFLYARRLAAALSGTFSLHLARQLQHPGTAGAAGPAPMLTLGDFYLRLRDGGLRLGTADSQWAFGLALLQESRAL